MLRALLAIFRPLYTIAKELTTIRELYELELANRYVNLKDAVPMPLSRVTEKPKKGDVEVSYQGMMIDPRWKQLDWEDGPENDVRE